MASSCQLFKSDQEDVSKNNGEDQREVVKLQTKFGDVYIWLYDATPKHKDNFLKLVGKGFYDSTTFHRVIDDFMIQGGDPNSKDDNPSNDGNGGPGYTLEAEIKDGLKHRYGSVAAARKGDNQNPQRKSNGSQFYIVENRRGAPHLDGKYTVFGKVIQGMQVVEDIADKPTNQKNRPKKEIAMQAEIVKMSQEKLKKDFNFEVPQ